MKLKLFVYCPDERHVIDSIIKAASSHGAGVYGKYSQVAFLTLGKGNWKPEKGAHPVEGSVGKTTRSPVVKIEMTCDSKKAKTIAKEIKKAHPWEQVDIEFVKLEKILS